MWLDTRKDMTAFEPTWKVMALGVAAYSVDDTQLFYGHFNDE